MAESRTVFLVAPKHIADDTTFDMGLEFTGALADSSEISAFESKADAEAECLKLTLAAYRNLIPSEWHGELLQDSNSRTPYYRSPGDLPAIVRRLVEIAGSPERIGLQQDYEEALRFHSAPDTLGPAEIWNDIGFNRAEGTGPLTPEELIQIHELLQIEYYTVSPIQMFTAPRATPNIVLVHEDPGDECPFRVAGILAPRPDTPADVPFSAIEALWSQWKTRTDEERQAAEEVFGEDYFAFAHRLEEHIGYDTLPFWVEHIK